MAHSAHDSAELFKQPHKKNIIELPHETTKTLQKLTPEGKNGSLPDEDCTVLVESGFFQNRERILPKRSYQMIEKLSEMLEFLAVLNSEQRRHSRFSLTLFQSNTTLG
jgi:hypothetical protein